MKVGLSLSRCVRDIVEGHIDIKDVLILITRTDFDPTDSEQWESIWNGYQSLNPEWLGLDHDATFAVVNELWVTGRIHQPRKFGAYPSRRSEFWLETVLVDGDLENNVAAKEAWDQFQTIAGLTDVNMDKEYR
jgi:hypothetical protein